LLVGIVWTPGDMRIGRFKEQTPDG
jgi:hypothetical protein